MINRGCVIRKLLLDDDPQEETIWVELVVWTLWTHHEAGPCVG